MKYLLLMRHGKSSWKDDSLTDHERPLKKRGRKDTKAIAKVIKKKDLIPDVILSSSATRARETVEILIEELKYKNDVTYSDDLYMAEPEDLISALNNLCKDIQTAMIVGHNPGLEAYLQMLDGEIEVLPTAGLGSMVLIINDWNEISLDTTGELIDFWTPKMLEKDKK